jgi:prephenate dehydrogenase
MAQVNVALIGLDRLNGSFGLAIKHLSQTAHQFTVTGSDEDRSVMDKAKELGAIDHATRDMDAAVENAELVFISMPYAVMIDIYAALGPVLKPGAVVVDLSLLKQPSIEWADKYFRKAADGQAQAYLVGVTPVINPAYLNDPSSNLDGAKVDLFDDGTLIIAPSAVCSPDAVRLITDLAGLMNVKVHFMDPAEHDGLIAGTEGLPLLLQVALFRTLSTSPGWEDLKRLTNPAFVLATYRLETDTAEDFGLFIDKNRANNIRLLEALSQTLDEMIGVLRHGDQLTAGELFSDSATQYVKWEADRGRNKWVDEGEMPRPPSRFFGGLGGMLIPSRGKKQDDSRR